MADRAQLLEALRAADAAGDVAAAQAIARRLAPQATTPQAPVQSQSTAPFERAGGTGPVLAGVGQAAIRGALGIKQFFGGLSDEDKGVLEEIKREAAADPEKGWRTAGDVTANIALAAIPGSKIEKALRGAKALPSALRAATAAAGSAGATEFALGVGEGGTVAEQAQSKVEGALKAAALSGAVGGALQKATRVFRPTTEAEALMKMDITPTLQQGAEGKIGHFVGGMSGGAFASEVADRQNTEVLREVLRRIDPKTDYTDARLSEIIGMAGKNLDTEFDNLFKGKKFTMSAKDKSAIWQAATKAAGNEPDVKAATLGELGRAGQALRTGNTITLGQGGMREQRNMVQDRINAVGREQTTKAGDIKKGLIAAKAKFDEVVRNRKLTPEEQATLENINSRMSDFKRLEDMAMSPSSHKKFKATSLLNSFATMDPKGGAGFARAENPMQSEVLEPAIRVLGLAGQDDTRAGLVALRRALPLAAASGTGAAAYGATALGAPLLAAPLAVGYGTSLLGQTKKGANVLFGNTATQRALAEQLRKGLVSPAVAGTYDQEGE